MLTAGCSSSAGWMDTRRLDDGPCAVCCVLRAAAAGGTSSRRSPTATATAAARGGASGTWSSKPRARSTPARSCCCRTVRCGGACCTELPAALKPTWCLWRGADSGGGVPPCCAPSCRPRCSGLGPCRRCLGKNVSSNACLPLPACIAPLLQASGVTTISCCTTDSCRPETRTTTWLCSLVSATAASAATVGWGFW